LIFHPRKNILCMYILETLRNLSSTNSFQAHNLYSSLRLIPSVISRTQTRKNESFFPSSEAPTLDSKRKKKSAQFFSALRHYFIRRNRSFLFVCSDACFSLLGFPSDICVTRAAYTCRRHKPSHIWANEGRIMMRRFYRAVYKIKKTD
jgi:hypothetical protein